MKQYDMNHIRNVSLIGHGDSGKTSLASAVLFCSGMVNRLGRVEEGNTVTDFDEDEIERKISINASLCFAEWEGFKLNIIDTPGYANFISEAKAALRVSDGAVVVVCGVAGIEVQTEKLWKFCDEFSLPRIIIINKLDRDRSSFSRTLESIHNRFGRKAIPIQMPIGQEKDFRGIIDLIEEKAYIFQTDGSGKFEEAEIPAEMKGEAQKQREQLIEMVAEMDEALMEKFFDAGTLSNEELIEGLKQGVLQKNIFPVVCCSATHNIGIQLLMKTITNFLPSPAEIEEIQGINPQDKSPISRKSSEQEPFSAFIFKTIADPYAGRISLFRVYSGSLKSDSTVFNASKKNNERIGSLAFLQGKTQSPVPEVQAGDFASVAKLKETNTGDTLCNKSAAIIYTSVKFPEPSISFAIQPKSRGDEEKISSSLSKLGEEDLTFKVDRDPQTKEMLVSGQGQLHVEVLVGKLKKKFGVEVILKPPKVPYRETVTATAQAQGKYKRQTGGHGQYGDCWIKVEPLQRGEGYEFVDAIVGGVIPRNYIPAVEKGIAEARQTGILAGYPTVDFKVTLYDGSYHTVDSSDLAFKIAGSLAFKKAMEQASPVLLEPIMNVEIHLPDEYMGDIMGDLSSRRGKVLGSAAHEGMQVIKAQVPMVEMLSYEPDLTSMTSGRGYYTMEFSHYDQVPTHIAQKILEEAQKAKEEKEK
jgi:elongation factor G